MIPQNYFISLDAPASSVLIRSATDATPLSSGPTLVHGDVIPVRIYWCREDGLGGAAVTEDVGDGSIVTLAARFLGVPSSSALLFQVTLDWNGAGYHEGTLNLNTEAVAAHLLADPPGAKTITVEAELADGATSLLSFQWQSTLTPQVYSDQTAPESLPTVQDWMAASLGGFSSTTGAADKLVKLSEDGYFTCQSTAFIHGGVVADNAGVALPAVTGESAVGDPGVKGINTWDGDGVVGLAASGFGGSFHSENPGRAAFFTGCIQIVPMTVAQIQALTGIQAGTKGFVTDNASTVFRSVIGVGGSSFVPVFYDGMDWRVG